MGEDEYPLCSHGARVPRSERTRAPGCSGLAQRHAVKRIRVQAELLQEEKIQKRRLMDEVPAPSLQRLAAHAVEPLEACVRDPRGRALESLGLVVDGAAEGKVQAHVREAVPVRENELLLAAAAETDEQHARVRAVDLADDPIHFLRRSVEGARGRSGADDHSAADFLIDLLLCQLRDAGCAATDEYRDALIIL